MNDAIFLSDLISSRTLKKMTGKHKKVYKCTICGLFVNIIYGKNDTKEQMDIISKLKLIQKLPRKKTNFDLLLNEISKIVHSSLEKSHCKKPYDDEFMDNVIGFLRNRLREMKDDGISLFQIKEISQILDMNKFYGLSCLEDHHWVEFSMNRHIIITFPEYILFNDLKVQWNYYIDVRANLLSSQANIKSRKDEYEYLKNEQNRADLFSSGALQRTLIVSCVSFVEAYLYDLFLSIKESNLPNKHEIESILKIRKIQDIEIIDRVLFYLFPELKQNADMIDFFERYKLIIGTRDRYIHASAFINTSSNKSDLEPLLNLDENSLVESLQLSVDFVKKINELLPEELKILFWMDSDQNGNGYNSGINFNEFSKLSLTNSKSNFNQRDYNNP